MWPFKQIKDWFTAGSVFQDTLAKTIAYLPVGDLRLLLDYQRLFLSYKPDVCPLGLDNYNGAELTIRAKGGDCESLAAFFVEVIRWWFGWESWHVCFVFTRRYNVYEAHDVAFFKRPDGSMGWIEAHPMPNSNAGGIYDGGYEAFRQHYDLAGWTILDWWETNDAGERLLEL